MSAGTLQVGGQNRDDLAVERLPGKIGISGESAPGILAGKARKCGRFMGVCVCPKSW